MILQQNGIQIKLIQQLNLYERQLQILHEKKFYKIDLLGNVGKSENLKSTFWEYAAFKAGSTLPYNQGQNNLI